MSASSPVCEGILISQGSIKTNTRHFQFVLMTKDVTSYQLHSEVSMSWSTMWVRGLGTTCYASWGFGNGLTSWSFVASAAGHMCTMHQETNISYSGVIMMSVNYKEIEQPCFTFSTPYHKFVWHLEKISPGDPFCYSGKSNLLETYTNVKNEILLS